MQTVDCNLCGSDKSGELFLARDYTFASEERFSYVKCPECGLVFLSPRPSPEEIGRYYPDQYYQKYGAGSPELMFLRGDYSEDIAKIGLPGRILDVGCQKGVFLKDMQDKGWDCYGVDISETACEIARDSRGLENIYTGDIQDVNLPENYFDVITLWHVIEHLYDPRAVICKLRKLLKPDGVLVIECPNIDSVSGRLFGACWQPLEAPRHLYQFSVSTLRDLMLLSGFRVRSIEYMPKPLMNMVGLKVSFLRFLGMEKPGMLSENPEKPGAGNLIKRTSLLWITARKILTFLCFILSMGFAYLKRPEIIRIYALPENKS